jgi:hypothetical protein
LREFGDCVHSRAMSAEQGESPPRSRSTSAAGLVLCAIFGLVGLNGVGLSHVDPWPAGARETLLVGSVELRPCQSVHAFCGTLNRPMDPTGAVPGRISIYFEYYPHSGPGKAAGTLVATER